MNADEIVRDLKNPKMVSTWNRQAATMALGAFTRSVGVRLAIVATAHLQARDLDHGLELGNRSVDILTRVQSSRAMDYVAEFNTALAPWCWVPFKIVTGLPLTMVMFGDEKSPPVGFRRAV